MDIIEQNTKEYFDNLIDKMLKLNDWGVLSTLFPHLSYDFINEHRYELNWYYICEHFPLDEDIIMMFGDLMDWNILSERNLSTKVIDKYADKINWEKLLYSNKFNEGFLLSHLRYINWHLLSMTQYLSEDFVWEFKECIDWNALNTKPFSNEFLKKVKDYINWDNVCIFPGKFTEDFIREMKDYVNWGHISYYQTMDKNFVLEFWNKIDFSFLLISSFSCLPKWFVKDFVKKEVPKRVIERYENDIIMKYDQNFYNELIKVKEDE